MKLNRPLAVVRTMALFAVVAWATLTAGFAPLSAQSGDPGAADEAIDQVLDQIEDAGGGLDLDEIDGLDALGPNPWLSMTANRSRKSVNAWTQVAAQLPDQAKVPKGKAKIGGPDLNFSESEATGETGVNDTIETGEKLPAKFGTDPGDRGVVTISGSLSGGVVRPPVFGDCEDNEDDGSIPLANPTPAAEFQVALCVGEIGNGPFGDSSGDIDFYSYGVVEEGTLLILDTFHFAGSLDPVNSFIGIYDADGNLLISGEDDGIPDEDDTFLELIAPADGEYFAAIAGCCDLSGDPFDSASGPGVGDTGTYELFVVAFPPPCSSEEDDGSIGLANETNVPEQSGDFCLGVIGDGPYGDADTDFYSLGFAPQGFEIVVEVFSGFDTPFDTVVGIYDAAGNLVASAEGGELEPGLNVLIYPAEADGEYFVGISGCCDLQGDPTDPASGVSSDQQGPYEAFLGVFQPPCRSVEDDGSIGLANETNVATQGGDVCFAEIGDGPYGAADTDFYSFGFVDEGFDIVADAFSAFEIPFNTVIGIYDAAGNLVASAEGSDIDPGFNVVIHRVETPGEYYAVVTGCCELQGDPNDPASGVESDQQGPYEVFLGAFPPPCESIEDDGSIDLANDVTGQGDEEIFVGECFGAVGDGPQAELAGDVDFFRTRPLDAGRLLIVDFADFFGEAAGAGDLTIGIYNEAGELIASGQDDPAQSGPQSDFFSVTVPEAGSYYVAVGGGLPGDPFDETSGTNADIVSGYSLMFVVDTTAEFIGGAGLTGWGSPRSSLFDRPERAQTTVQRSDFGNGEPMFANKLEEAKQEAIEEAEAAEEAQEEEPVVDTDFFLVHLNRGDVIAGGFDGARTTGIIDPDGVQRSGAQFNPSFIYPESSPLRHDRFNGLDHVATVTGQHAVFVSDGVAEYEGELRVVRSGLAGDKTRDQQIIFLDFDGATLPGDVFGTGFDADMSPLSDFLGRWDLTAEDEDAVIDATIDAVVETLDTDLRVLDGRNGDRDQTGKGTQFDVEILNSRDHGDRWGEPNVSRVIIGGTINEVQIPTIGIAQSIDPGNLETEETAIVLLDIMSEPAGGVGSPSINSYDLADGVTKAEFVGFVVGNITAHEIGHFIGNWHQETFNEVLAIMDAGGDFPAIAGVGSDGVYGTADDTDPDFVEDVFNSFEGFTGVEDTAGRSVFGLSTGNKQVPRGGGPR